MPRLTTILARDGLALPGIKLSAMTVDVEKVFHRKGWRVLVRGPRVFFVSPEGTAFEDARSKFMLGWAYEEGDDALKQTDQWSSPLDPRPKPVVPPPAPPRPVAPDDLDDDDVPIDTVKGRKR